MVYPAEVTNQGLIALHYRASVNVGTWIVGWVNIFGKVRYGKSTDFCLLKGMGRTNLDILELKKNHHNTGNLFHCLIHYPHTTAVVYIS